MGVLGGQNPVFGAHWGAFWTLFGVLLLWFAMNSLLVYAMETRKFGPLMSIPQSDTLVNLLSNTLALTVYEQLFSWIDCSFYSDATQASLDQDTFHYLPCWTGMCVVR